MIVISRDKLKNFQDTHPDAKSHVSSWLSDVERKSWSTPHDVKQDYPKASIVGGKNVIFNILGNSYRLWVKINYVSSIIMVEKIGTHKEYDKWRIK